MSSSKEKSTVVVETLTELRPGKVSFSSRGYARIKIVQIVDGVDRVTCLNLPISAGNISKVLMDWAKKMPRPPAVDKLFSPDSEVGKAMGLTKAQVLTVPDTADPKYIERLEEFNLDQSWAVAAAAIDLPLYIRDDSVPGGERQAKGEGERINALKGMDLQPAHIMEIANTARNLLNWTEEERLGFSSASSASK